MKATTPDAAARLAFGHPGLTTWCEITVGLPMPISWDEVPDLKRGEQWTITTAREYVSFQKVDLWAMYWKSKQTLTGAMNKFGYPPTSEI
jgi:DNA primase